MNCALLLFPALVRAAVPASALQWTSSDGAISLAWWSPAAGNTTFRVTCNSIDASGDGWCAFGIADSLLGNYPSSPMAVSSAVVWDLPDVSLVEYDIDSLFDPKNHGMKSSTPRIKSSALEPASKTFEFTVPHMIGQRSIDAAGDTNLVWAFKASGGWGKHSDTGYSTLNLATGAATAPILSPAKVLHIVCMALAWGLFLPLGIVQSMAFKRGPCSSCGPWWFVAHIVLNVIGLGTMLVGGFFAFRIVPDGAHWTDPCVGVRWTWPTERARARLCSLPRHHPSCSPARRSQRYYSFRARSPPPPSHRRRSPPARARLCLPPAPSPTAVAPHPQAPRRGWHRDPRHVPPTAQRVHSPARPESEPPEPCRGGSD